MKLAQMHDNQFWKTQQSSLLGWFRQSLVVQLLHTTFLKDLTGPEVQKYLLCTILDRVVRQ